jgi:hypothetical protein
MLAARRAGEPAPGSARHRLAAAAVVLVAALVAGCAGAQSQAGAQAGSTDTTSAAAAPSPSPSRSPTPSPSVIAIPPPPAGLAQTRALPSAHTPVFSDEMRDLWTAILTGNPSIAVQSFFPLSAYQQVKAISDATADWHTRLVGDYVLDIQAAHDFLGANAAAADLVQVIVPSPQYAAWIVPGVCFNKVGYWHVPGARLVYRLGGQLHSIGIASLISWRGQWYVVHLGAVVRNTTAGIVDTPSLGTGTPGPPGGC